MGAVTEDFYKNVKAMCKQKNVAMGNLEYEVKIPTGYYARCVRIGSDISLAIALRTCKVLGVDVNDMVDNDIV
jgi:hypothetical protein